MRSEAKSWYHDSSSMDFAPDKAYDGNFQTFYSVKVGDAMGNYLKLHLSEKFRIGTVMLTNREDCCQERIIGTVVMMYLTEGGSETEVAPCGKEITTGTSLVLVKQQLTRIKPSINHNADSLLKARSFNIVQ